jgi:hypothetical protein
MKIMSRSLHGVLIFPMVSILTLGSAFGHRPIFTQESGANPETAVPFGDPDISQVVYRELTPSQPQVWFTVSVPKDFDLFVQIGVPVINRLQSFRPSLALIGPGLAAVKLPFSIPEGMGGVVFSTKEVEQPRVFYEHFTGTESWILRSESIRLSEPGRYYLVVFNPEGQEGKFWVAIGRREAFSLKDLLEFPLWRKRIREFHEISTR